ncbi:MAG: response regulator receiver modulated serine phosphatase [Solirubrobacterales bacterium]|nr:response regulator receiver modulated serine phosphatase [Solirubrobacterales bacterium]
MDVTPNETELRRQAPVGHARSVLLVEDDEDDAVFVADLLEGWPEFELTAVTSLGAAAAHLARAEVHCVLLDLNLPDAVGLEALERLLAQAADLAVVVLTGDSEEDLRGAAAVAAGAQDYLVKGRIDGGTLVRAIRYATERRSSERWRQEAAVGRMAQAENARLQRGLLPAPILLDDAVRVVAAYRPGQRRQLLGGDFYDVVQTADGVLHAVVGDVSGHGPDEAALGVRLRMAWRTLVLSGAPTAGLFGTVDLVLGHERDHLGVFSSMVEVRVAADRATASVRLAGHPAPVLVAGGRARLVEECAGGPILGLDAPASWPATTLALPEAWTLLLYTDGLYEGWSGDGDRRLGVPGLVAVMDEGLGRTSTVDEQSLRDLITAVEQRHGGALTDDVALLAISGRRSG